MQKNRPLALADTNIAMLGTALEKNIRKDASDHEPAWNTAGKQAGLEIWRVEKFKIVAWPKAQYGTFYNGDSYIVLNTIKQGPSLAYDVHFWLGQFTSQDEAGTAAYKTVELDDHLGTLPVQHREVQGFESPLFLSYFGNAINILEGGVETGFKTWKDPGFTAKLLHVVGSNMRDVRVLEVPLAVSSVNGGDVFILDQGKTLTQWNGAKAGIFEKNKAAQVVRKLDDERKNVTVQVIDQGDKDEAAFFQALGGAAGAKVADQGAAPRGLPKADPTHKKLFSVSDATGSLVMKQVAEGKAITKGKLDTKDAFVLDNGDAVWVWVGKGASVKERRYALQYAQKYLVEQKRPLELPIGRVVEGGETKQFWDAVAA